MNEFPDGAKLAAGENDTTAASPERQVAEPCYYCDGTDVCPECKGEKDVQHECAECGDSHWCVCPDCGGTGRCSECEAWARIEAKKAAEKAGGR